MSAASSSTVGPIPPSSSRERWLKILGYAGLLVLAWWSFFSGMGRYGIINGNESLYVESAREMVLSGQWAIPTLNDFPYLEKPPLLIWLLAAARLAFGTSEWAARLVTACAGLTLVLALTRYSVMLGIGRYGFAAAFILMTSLGMDVMSRVAMPDLLLTLLFSCACFSAMAAFRQHSPGHWRLGMALLGLSALIKGPLSIALFGLILLADYAMTPAHREWLRKALRDPWAGLLLITPLSLWLLAIEWRQPGSAYYFIVNEHILRFLGLREPHDYYSGSVFYYVPRLLLFLFPWAGVFLFGWLSASRKAEPAQREVRRFLWLCVGIPFAFFSASSAKANYYIILCLPAIALLTADYLPELLRARRRAWLVLSIALPVMSFVVVWAWRVWAVRNGQADPIVPVRDGSGALTIAVLLCLSMTALCFAQMGWRRVALLCVGGLILPVSFQFDHLVDLAEPVMSARNMASYIRQNAPHATVYLYQDFETVGALPIYLERTLPVIDCQSNDLYYGSHLQPSHPNLVSAAQVLARDGERLVVVMNDREATFQETPLAAKATMLTQIGRFRLYRLDNSGLTNAVP